MSKKMLGFLIGVILFGITMAGATFAFFTSAARTGNNQLAGANEFSVDVYTTNAIEGPITLGISKEAGLSSQVQIKMDNSSVLSKANLYFNITDIANNMLSDNTTSWKKALMWELYSGVCQEIPDGEEETTDTEQEITDLELIDTGNFLECSETGQKTCVNGDKLYMYKDFQLTYDMQCFNVYVWLDGNIADNGVEGAYIKATVSAETEEFSADLN